MTEVADPWYALRAPDEAANISGRRVDPSLRWNLFWAVDTDRHCLLVLRHDPSSSPRASLPTLKGLEIEDRPALGDEQASLIVRLKDREQREIFHTLCLDIISATKPAESEGQAIERFLARTWRWHRLLKGGPDGRLTDDEQKGLIGELVVLRDILIPVVGAEPAVNAWRGPMGAPKDFEIGSICIEAKARRGPATPFVAISNEHQLDTEGLEALYLHVCDVTSTTSTDPGSLTVLQMAREVLDLIEDEAPAAIDLYEQRLTAIGLEWQHDYSDKPWVTGNTRIFKVEGDFPRIIPAMFPSGASNVRYTIALQECASFLVDSDDLRSSLAEQVDGYQH